MQANRLTHTIQGGHASEGRAKDRTLLAPLTLLAITLLSSGCAPVGGLLPSDNKVVIDENSVSPELRTSLARAKTLAFAGSLTTKSNFYMAAYLEEHGGYEVILEETPDEASPSMRRKLRERICRRADRPDLVISFSPGQSDADGGTILIGGLIGRVNYTVTGTSDVLRCRDKWKSEFSMRIEFAQGVFNADNTKVAQILGVEFAKELMQIADKSRTVRTTTQQNDSSAAVTNVQRASAYDSSLVMKIQKQLSKQGYQLVADGLYGPNTKATIADWQSKNGIIADGIPSQTLLAALRASAPVEPASQEPVADSPPSASTSSKASEPEPARKRATPEDIAPAVDRRVVLSEKYGAKIADAILKNEVIAGMPAEAVILALGEPENKNIIDKDELWHYKNKDVVISSGTVIHVSE